MKLKTKIEIEIKNIVVDDRYYDFDAVIIRDGKTRRDHYNSDYDGQTAADFKKVLESGEALSIVLQDLSV